MTVLRLGRWLELRLGYAWVRLVIVAAFTVILLAVVTLWLSTPMPWLIRWGALILWWLWLRRR